MSINWQENWDQVSRIVRYGAGAAGDAAGHGFKVLAHLKDDIPTYNRVLHTARYIIGAIKYDRQLNGGDLSISSFEKVLDGAITAIDVTRFFSVAHYFASGAFVEDVRSGNYGGAVSEVSFAVADCLKAYVGVDEIIQMANGVEATRDDTTELLEDIGNWCTGLGYLGQIAKNIHELVTTNVGNVQAWLNLAAAVAGIAMSILVCAGVTFMPVLIAFGLLSLTLGIVSSVWGLYANGEDGNGLSPDFANNNLGLVTALGPLCTVATLVDGQPGAEPLVELAGRVGPFREQSGGLTIITRLKEWFTPERGARFWERANWWKIGSKLSATAQSGLDFASYLASVGAIDGAFKKNPLFKGFKNAFATVTSTLSIVDNAMKLHELRGRLAAREFKVRKWELLSTSLQVPPVLDSWAKMQADLVQHYNFKVQAEMAKNGLRSDGGNSYHRDLADVIFNGETARYIELKSPARRLGVDDAYRLALARGEIDGVQLTEEQRINFARDLLSPEKRAKLERQAANLGECDKMKFVEYKKALADYKFSEVDVARSNATWQIISDVFKIASAIVSFVAIFFASVLGVFVTLFQLASALANGAKYCADAFYKKMAVPVTPAAAAAAAAAAVAAAA